MYESILNWFLKHYPHLCILIVLVFLAIWSTYKILSVYYRHFKPIKKDVFDLKEDNQTLKSNFIDIKMSLKIIETYLMTKDKSAASLLKSQSPYSLSDLGWEVLKISGAEKVLNDYLDFFISEIEKENPLTALDVESKANEILLKNSDSDKFNAIKNFIYNNPKYKDSDMSIPTVVFAMSIYLRDKYFVKHPETNLSEKVTE